MDATPIPVPGRPTPMSRLARAALAVFGWREDIRWPPVPRCVVIVYPHTSNWDFVVGSLAKAAAGLPAQWIGKHTIFRWPFAGVLRRMGGIPVNRREAAGLVDALVREMKGRPWMWLAMAPEGTRAKADHWKSGFYRLAVEAGVPVGLAFIDWRDRVVGLHAYLRMTGDEEKDLASIREAYAGKVGRWPEQAAPIRLRPERRA